LSTEKNRKYGLEQQKTYQERLKSLMELNEGEQGSYMVTAFTFTGIRHAFAIVKD
jgi:hypothetical protein